MGIRIEVKNDVTRALEEVEGSDGRMNVSSRSGSRSYYVSRDQELAFSVAFQMQSAAAGEFFAYWLNTSTDGKHLVIDAIGINSVVGARVKLVTVTGTAAGGTQVTPANLNLTSAKDAPATAWEGASAAAGLTGLTATGILLDFVGVPALGHEEMRLGDRVRIGQGQAIALEMDEAVGAAATDVWGVIFGFYE